MILTVRANTLLQFLKPAYDILGSSKLSNDFVKIVADEYGLHIFGVGSMTYIKSDLLLGTSVADGNLQISSYGEVVVSGKILYNTLKEFSKGNDEMAIAHQNRKLSIKTLSGTFKISCNDLDDFPNVVYSTDGEQIEIDSNLLFDMSDRVIDFVSKDEYRPVLMGLNINFSGNNFIVKATNGHVLSMVNLDGFQSSNEASATIMPECIKILEGNLEKGYSGSIKMTIGKEKMSFVAGSLTVVSHLLQGQYPNTDRIMPNPVSYALVPSNEFITAIRRSLVLADRDVAQIFLSLDSGKLVIASGAESGDSSQLIDIDYSGEELKFSFNGRYLMNVFSRITSERVKVGVTDSMSAFLFEPEIQKENKNHKSVVMPIKIPE